MKKKIYMLAFLAIPLITYSQVGIKITSPKTTLDVNGSLQLTKKLYVGGDAYTIGDPGSANDILTSQGAGKAPLWKSLPDMNVPTIVYATAKTYTSKPTIAAYASYMIPLPSDNLDSDLITPINTTTLAIKKSGAYLITYSISISVIGSDTDGTAIMYMLATTGTTPRSLFHKNSAYAVAPKPISTNSAGVVLLEANTNLNFVISHTRNCLLEQYAVTITFLSAK